MNRFITKSIALIALVGVFTVFSTSKAEAALSLTITTSAGASLTVNDNGAGDAANLLLGAISNTSTLGQWVLNITGGLGDPLLADQPHMDLSYNSTNVGGAAGDWIQFDLVQTNTMTSSPTLGMKLGGTNNGTSVQAWALVNGVIVGTLGPSNSAVVGLLGSAPNGAATPYTLAERVRLTRTGTGGTALASGDFEIVPEAATLALLGLGLATLAARRRRKA
jgi:hypothetical protein